LQAYLRINPNTPAYNREKKTLHNDIMYQWSSQQKNTLLITGHTHQPVFASLTYLERLYKEFQLAGISDNTQQQTLIKEKIREIEKNFAAVAVDYMSMHPGYFNSGCCCFSDGDITGLEISDGSILLIKWTRVGERSERQVLESISIGELMKQLKI
jgi:hypothetical protein